jgi:hypothetical protein
MWFKVVLNKDDFGKIKGLFIGFLLTGGLMASKELMGKFNLPTGIAGKKLT